MNELKDKFCIEPWSFFTIGDGYSAQCCYLAKQLKEVENDDINDVWNSEDAKEVRRSILDGSFRYCKKDLCPKIQGNTLPNRIYLDEDFQNVIKNNIIDCTEIPSYIHLCNDDTCNFQCPSCRDELRIRSYSKKEFETKLSFLNKIVERIKNTNKEVSINMSGSGEPFASKLFRTFLLNLDGTKIPNLRIGLQTNGSLLTPLMWDKIEKIHRNLIHILMSFDAITKETYEIIRKGGKWNTLQRNFKNILKKREEENLNFYFELSFIVQQRNYKEIPDFIKFCIDNNVTPGLYLIYKWYDDDSFFDNAIIYDERHPEYNDFIKTINNPELDKYNINWGNLTQFRNK